MSESEVERNDILLDKMVVGEISVAGGGEAGFRQKGQDE